MNKRQRKKAYKKLVKRMKDAWLALAKEPKPDYFILIPEEVLERNGKEYGTFNLRDIIKWQSGVV